MNRGECSHLIEIWENKKSKQKNKMGEYPEYAVKVKEVFAKLEFRGGGLLSGRIADTVLTLTTQKFTFPYYDYPNLVADRNFIVYENVKYNILYTLDENNKHEWLQVFTNERGYK